MVQDHLRFKLILTFGSLAEIDQAPGVEQRIGIALQAARVPGKIDQQATQYLSGVGAGRLFRDLWFADLVQVRTLLIREIERFVGAVGIKKGAVIANRFAAFRRLPDILLNCRA